MTRRDCLLELTHGALIVLALILAVTAGMYRMSHDSHGDDDEE
jgi:hypothetical protein